MAFHQCHLTLYIGSSSSFKCHSTFLIPFPCRKRPTHVSFLPALNSTGLGLTVGNGAVSRESKVLGDFDLENEIFEFMQNSEKPDSFPTKEELMAAGRVDLVNAILAEDGWLSAGWVEEEERNVHLETGTGSGYALRNSVDGLPSYSLASYSSSVVSKSSSLGRLTEAEHSSEGIEGILNRLEKERAAFYPLESRKRDETRLERERTMEQTRYSWGNLTKMYGGQLRRPSEAMSTAEGALSFPSQMTNIFLDRSGEQCCTELSFTREHNSSNPHQASEIQTSEKDDYLKTDFEDAIYCKEEWDMDGKKRYRESYQECMHSRIEKLESELSAMVHLVRSGEDAPNWSEKCRNSLEKLHDLCEAWEFQENEIMKSHAKLRATRAKLSILEGKMALKIMEAQKVAEEKRSEIEEGQCLLSLLRTTSIVWSNSGDDVLLVGSFDGWTSQRRMERTSSGVFVLNLKLYPGRYEIKFIVDGMWRIDPLRTVLSNNGHENNLLVVS
ncbi:protein PTST homolog 2, chloroplastic-like [Nymphaea colorata]|nr:protein PTST homolog 2, chloroplastic-like [Nymphaea colorata]